MERAKRIATAIIGVTFAANYCGPALAQTPNRFIRQPAKAPAIPTPVATVTPEPVQTAAVVEAEVAKEAAKLAHDQPQSFLKSDGPHSFPSLASRAASPDFVFDTLETFATVPVELGSDRPTQQNANLDSHLGELEQLVPVTQTPTPFESSTRTAAPRAGQLQWTSRANVSHARSETHHTNTGSQNQLDANPARNTLSFNGRTNSNSLTTYSPHDFQPETGTRQQSESTNAVKTEKLEEPASQDRIRAGLVSARITNDPRFATQTSQTSVTRIESPQGWQAIGSRLSEHVKRCESLLGRGAFCSAREEAETASMLLYRHIDLHDNLFRCEPAVQSANQALREAEDFLVTLRSTADGESLRRLVNAHETPVLKNKNLTGMSPLTAAQHYRQFAEAKLVEAAQGHPWASELLYTVGRTYQAEAEANSSRVDVLRMKAMAHYLASRTTLPSNAVTCNQLGYLLLQMDRNEEAREALVAAVTIKQDEASLSNLAEASRRLGDTQTVAWAAQSVAAIRRRAPPTSPVPPFVEVSQEDFIAISPREIGPKTQSDSSPNIGSQSPVRSAATPNAGQLR